MNIRLTNLTGKALYYKVIDYEGPYASFSEDALPGMYPNGQSGYTDSDVYFENLGTKVGNQRYTLSSRYPKFNAPQDYMMNFSMGQRPSHRSYDEVKHNYPEQQLNGRTLNGNHEGIIPIGLHRDLMLRDQNCNLYFRTTGKPKFSPVYSTAKFDILSGAPTLFTENDPHVQMHRNLNYEATIKAARLRENHLILAINYDGEYHMYDESGTEVKVEFPYDVTAIALEPLKGSAVMKQPLKGRYFPNYPFASVDTEPLSHGTYIDSLRDEAIARKKAYSRKYVDMTNSNYSDDYDSPILGYFDRRFLYKQHGLRQ